MKTPSDYLPFERGIKDGLLIYLRRLGLFLAVLVALVPACVRFIRASMRFVAGLSSRARRPSTPAIEGCSFGSIATASNPLSSILRVIRKTLSPPLLFESGRHPIYVTTAYVSALSLGAITLLAHVRPPLLPQLHRSANEAPSSSSYCAPFGEHRSITLPDGSTLELNSNTCIAARVSAKDRMLQLDSGEAIFQVAHHPTRPFVVETGPISIRALGTQFEVYRTARETRVAVIDGAVQISSGGTTARTNIGPLTTLQQIEIPDDSTQPRVRRPITSRDFNRITAWVHGDIELDNQTLQDTLEELARYQHIKFEFKDRDLAQMRFSGKLHTNEVRSFLELLKFKCIHSEYDEVAQRITLSSESDEHAGSACQ